MERDCSKNIQISTPKGNQPRSIASDSLGVDRLSIIPKFNKSFAEDSEDFEVSTKAPWSLAVCCG